MAALRIDRPQRREIRGRQASARGFGVRLGRWVLAWFCLSLGVAIASPVVHPQTFELVCSTAGAGKVVVKTDEGVRELGASHLDCPLCLPASTAPPPPVAALPPPLPRATALAPAIPATVLAAADGLAPPARGPPSLS